MAGKPSLSPGRTALLDRLVKEGVTVTDLQKVHGFNYSTIRRLHPNYRAGSGGLLRRIDALKVDSETSSRVYEMLEDGCSATEIARTLNVTLGQIEFLQMGSAWDRKTVGKYGGMVAKLNSL